MNRILHTTPLELAQALEANEMRVHAWKALIDAYAHDFGKDGTATDAQKSRLAELIRALNAVEVLVAENERQIGTNIN